MDKVIITSIIYDFRSFSFHVSKNISVLVEEIRNKYDWFLEIKQYGGTIQAVLNTNDINVGLEVAKMINKQYEKSTTMVSVGEVEIDERYPDTKIVGQNNSKGFWGPGKRLDELVKKKKMGIFIYP